MLASAVTARRRRLHSRGSDTAAERPALSSVSPLGRAAAGARHQERQHAGSARRATHHEGPRPAACHRRRRPRPAACDEPLVPVPRPRTAVEHGQVVEGEMEKAARAPPPSSELTVICAVCLEELRGGATALPCSHAYHPNCVRPWLAVHRACPCCRASVPALPES